MNGLILTSLSIPGLWKGLLNYTAVVWFYLSGYGHFQHILISWAVTAKMLCLPNYGPKPNCKDPRSPSLTYIIKECAIYQRWSERGSHSLGFVQTMAFIPHWAAITQSHWLGGLNTTHWFAEVWESQARGLSSKGANSITGTPSSQPDPFHKGPLPSDASTLDISVSPVHWLHH